MTTVWNLFHMKLKRENHSESAVTHLCLLTSLHSLHEHHVLPAPLPLLAEHRHMLFYSIYSFHCFMNRRVTDGTQYVPLDMHNSRSSTSHIVTSVSQSKWCTLYCSSNVKTWTHWSTKKANEGSGEHRKHQLKVTNSQY